MKNTGIFYDLQLNYGLKPEKVQCLIIRQLKQTVILLNTLPSALADGA